MTCWVCHRPVGDLRECPYCDEPISRPKWERRLVCQIVLLSFGGIGLWAYSLLSRHVLLLDFPMSDPSVAAIASGVFCGILVSSKFRDFYAGVRSCCLVFIELVLLTGIAYLYPKAFYVVHAVIAKHGLWLAVAACFVCSLSAERSCHIPVFGLRKQTWLLFVPKMRTLSMTAFFVGMVVLIVYSRFPNRLLCSIPIGIFVGTPLFMGRPQDVAKATHEKFPRLEMPSLERLSLGRLSFQHATWLVVFCLGACFSLGDAQADPLRVSLVFSMTVLMVLGCTGILWVIQRRCGIRRDDVSRSSHTRNAILVFLALAIIPMNGIPGLGVILVSVAWMLAASLPI